MNLSIDPNVVSDWGLWEAVREIIQGAIDECGDDYEMAYDETEQRLTILNNGKLTRSSLLIGHSTKRNDKTKIGQHGEGYKNSIAILLRENKEFCIYNNDEIWTFSYKYDRRFRSNVIAVDIKKWFVKKTKSIAWEITNITPEEYKNINKCLCTHCDIRGVNGDILLDEPGNVYSGGLFVCYNDDLHFGYNFDIGGLELQRDRNLINNYDIFSKTSICWSESEDAVTHARDGIKDVFYLEFCNKSRFSTQAHKLFVDEYGTNAYPISSEKEKIPNVKNVIVGETYKRLIWHHPGFKKIIAKSPKEILTDWYINHPTDMEKFKDIVKLSENWIVE